MENTSLPKNLSQKPKPIKSVITVKFNTYQNADWHIKLNLVIC